MGHADVQTTMKYLHYTSRDDPVVRLFPLRLYPLDLLPPVVRLFPLRLSRQP
jgi:hypothetical protein